MPTLVLTFEGKVIREYAFLKTGMTIGRSLDNTIVIDNLAVSSHHAKVEEVGSDYVLTDLDSTNGTFLNEAKVTSETLADGDSITIGKHTIRFMHHKQGPQAETMKEDPPSTMVLDTAKYKELLAKQEKSADASEAAAPQPAPASTGPTNVRRWLRIAVIGAIGAGLVSLL